MYGIFVGLFYSEVMLVIICCCSVPEIPVQFQPAASYDTSKAYYAPAAAAPAAATAVYTVAETPTAYQSGE